MATVTPDLARRLLAKAPGIVNLAKVGVYAQAMREGSWRGGVGAPIRIRDGIVTDGKARLAACVQSGCDVVMTIAIEFTAAEHLMA
jgi:hypothetical protein